MQSVDRHGLLLQRLLLGMLLSALCLGLSVRAVRADMGPKPSMEFEFVYETDEALTIVEGTQLECEDAQCAHFEPLGEFGPQRLTCTASACSSLAYTYADYHRLELRFSDGVTRESNVFGKSHFDATYRVTVREDDLWIEETGGRMNPMLLVVVGSLVGALLVALLCGLALVIFIVLIVKACQDKACFESSRWLFILTWPVILPLYAVGGYFSLTLPITVVIEGVVALIYAHVQKRLRFTLLTLVALVNLITQPFVWFFVMARMERGFSLGLIILELIIVGVEAALLFAVQRKTRAFKECLILSLWLNVASFIVGLLLPV